MSRSHGYYGYWGRWHRGGLVVWYRTHGKLDFWEWLDYGGNPEMGVSRFTWQLLMIPLAAFSILILGMWIISPVILSVKGIRWLRTKATREERRTCLRMGLLVVLIVIGLKVFYCDLFYCPHSLTPEQERQMTAMYDKIRADTCAAMKRNKSSEELNKPELAAVLKGILRSNHQVKNRHLHTMTSYPLAGNGFDSPGLRRSREMTILCSPKVTQHHDRVSSLLPEGKAVLATGQTMCEPGPRHTP